jgi:hypothetical protein
MTLPVTCRVARSSRPERAAVPSSDAWTNTRPGCPSNEVYADEPQVTSQMHMEQARAALAFDDRARAIAARGDGHDHAFRDPRYKSKAVEAGAATTMGAEDEVTAVQVVQVDRRERHSVQSVPELQS